MDDEQKQKLHQTFEQIRAKMNLFEIKNELQSLEARSYEQSFWNNHKEAADIMKRIADIKQKIDDVEMMELLLAEGEYDEAAKLIDMYEIQLFLSGKYDLGDAIFAIHAGQRGTEAMDWTGMLFRMYTRYFER